MTEAKPKTENTNQFKKLQEFLKKNITLIVLLINAVGFVNYFIYYKSFGIPIFNYVGLNDLIFFVLEYVLSIVLVILFGEIIYQILSLCFEPPFLGYSYIKKIWNKYKAKTSKEDRQKIEVKDSCTFRQCFFYLYVALSLIGIYLVSYLFFRAITIPVCIIYALYQYASSKEKGLNEGFIIIVSIVIVIGLFVYTINNTIEKSQEKQDYTISFVENNELITTEKGESTLNYLGESSVAIFLYDIECEEARIYNKSNVTDIRTQPSELYVWIIDCMLSVRN